MKKWIFPFVLGLVAIPLLGLYLYGVWLHAIPLYPVVLAYTLMSLLTLAVYHHDKCAAIDGKWRIPEATLHLLEALGGWPGALLAQLVFRHKLKKRSFQLIFWSIVIVHCAAGYLIYAKGSMRQARDLLPKSVTSYFSSLPEFSLPEFNFSNLLPSSGKTNGVPQRPEPGEAPPPAPAPQSLADVWASDPATAPLINDPKVHRSRIIANKQSRRLTGEIKAVSPSHGILLSLPPEIGGDGVIAPSTLIPDFYRRFRIGEKVEVAVKGVSMKGSQKQLELLLVEQ